jgi:serine/threonine protein kinase
MNALVLPESQPSLAASSAGARKPGPGEHAASSAEPSGDDARLRQQVQALPTVREEAGDPVQAETVTGPAATVRISLPPSEQPGEQIGRYKLLQPMGEGGMGAVWMAEQTEPVRRRVALKVIKLGMDTKEVMARFEAERQALAMMDHPNIAKVLDAGATCNGRPYFVMELVQGIRITDYCDRHHLSTQQRLDLFGKVCQAVQHAHQKGIIHRDLKPSNILVCLQDGEPVPKVIDFGIAKATAQRLTEKTLVTELHAFLGTPAYMSPEQAEMSGLEIDTRSDIYSLGVLLYELLTGQTPFETRALLAAGVDEMRRIIREEEPPRPSTRLSKLAMDEAAALSKQRQERVPALVSAVRGDLDWIVMKCLEKDRTRRYETASALATDLQRHLNNEPIEAGRPSRLHRLQKLLRRNQRALASAGVAAGAVLTLLLVLLVLFRAKVARALAVPPPKALPAEVKALAAAHVLETVYTGAAPAVAGSPPPQLQFNILARRQGAVDFSQLQDADTLASRVDDYLLVARPLSKGHLYIFQVDASGRTQWIFPRNDTFEFSSGTNPVQPDRVLQMPPAERKAFYLDQTAGIEHVYVVFSAGRWPELEAALSKPSPPAPPAGSGTDLVQAPNHLLNRGIEATHDFSSLAAVPIPLSVERIEDGKAHKLLVGGRPFQATGAFLVIERWFNHVNPR